MTFEMTSQMTSQMTSESLRVGLLGHGAIGSAVAAGLEAGKVEKAELAAVLDPWAPHPIFGVGSLPELLDASDVVVEAAGHDALREHGCEVRAAGADLLVVSVGALADEELHQDLLAAGGRQDAATLQKTGGKLYITTGAIGGLEALKAVARAGAINRVEMTSRKPAASLAQPWMDEALSEKLLAGDAAEIAKAGGEEKTTEASEIVAFSGPAREACGLFPQSANVCATLSLATIGFDETLVTMVGDPARKLVRHEIRVEAESGVYEFAFENATSPGNPKTSAIVPYAVLRGLSSLTDAVSRDGFRFV